MALISLVENNEVSNNLKHLSSLQLTEDQKRFTFDEIFYR